VQAQTRREKIDALREKQAELRVRKEMEEVTLKPRIHASQKHVLGLAAHLSPNSTAKKRASAKLEKVRQELEEKEMQGCTFQPIIDQKSNAMMEDRLTRIKIEGGLHDHLYEEAKRRDGRYAEYIGSEIPEATFCPNIGRDHFRPPNDCSREDFLNRLAYSKKSSSIPKMGKDEFRPKIGRPPNARNSEGLPVGQFLYNSGLERNERLERKSHASEGGQHQPTMSSSSRQRFEAEIHPQDVSSEGLDPDIVDFIKPVIEFVKKDNSCLTKDGFSDAMEYVIDNSGYPVSHLFVDHRAQSPPTEFPFTPRLNKNSDELEKNRRNTNLPREEQLGVEQEAYDATRQKRVLEKADEVMKECTFQPNVRQSSRSPRNGKSPRNAKSEQGSSIYSSRSDPCLFGARRKKSENAVDAAEIAVRRCRDVVRKAKQVVQNF